MQSTIYCVQLHAHLKATKEGHLPHFNARVARLRHRLETAGTLRRPLHQATQAARTRATLLCYYVPAVETVLPAVRGRPYFMATIITHPALAKLVLLLALGAGLFSPAGAADNGLAQVPPRGWLGWTQFRCQIRCDFDSANCIHERLFMQIADVMVSEGWRDAGYTYLNLDDCWQDMERDASDDLQPDPDRFPSGMKHLADYLHTRQLKLGVYTDYGTKTCMGRPGSYGHLAQDAAQFAKWGVDR